MVASIDSLNAGKVEYYLARYYLELDGDRLRSPAENAVGATRKSQGTWLESDATRHFGLSGPVRPKDFRELLRGFRDGQPIVQNPDAKNRNQPPMS